MEHGVIESFRYCLIFIALFGAISDFIFKKIFNVFTLSSAILGIVVSACVHSWEGVFQSFLGLFSGFIFYIFFYIFGVMGGGDVKFLMALGAWGGFYFVEQVFFLSICVGGVISLGVLTFEKKLGLFIQRLIFLVLTLVVRDLKFEYPKIDRKSTIPFGVPIAIASILAIFYDFKNFFLF